MRKRLVKSATKDRKEAIIQAALACYMRNGIAHTSSSEIAKLAKVDPPLIHYYFPELEDLHLAAIEKALESLRAHMVKGVEIYPDDPYLQMRSYLQSPLSWLKENPELMTLWLYFYYCASKQGRFQALNDTIRKTGRERIAKYIYEGIESGIYTIPADETVARLALDIQSQITGITILFASESLTSLEQCSDLITSRVFKMLGARK